MNQLINSVIAVVMIGYLAKAMPKLPIRIEALFSIPIFNIIFVASLMYLKTENIAISILSSAILFGAIYLIKLAIREPFEDVIAYGDVNEVDMWQIEHDQAEVGKKQLASESINSMLADITEKASDVQNFYTKQCQCNGGDSAKFQLAAMDKAMAPRASQPPQPNPL